MSLFYWWIICGLTLVLLGRAEWRRLERMRLRRKARRRLREVIGWTKS